jgi:hypothetical protein
MVYFKEGEESGFGQFLGNSRIHPEELLNNYVNKTSNMIQDFKMGIF